MLGLTIIIVVMLPLSISLQTIVRQEQTKAENAGLTKTIAYKDSIAPVLKKNCSLCHSEGGKIFRYLSVRPIRNGTNAGKAAQHALEGKRREPRRSADKRRNAGNHSRLYVNPSKNPSPGLVSLRPLRALFESFA